MDSGRHERRRFRAVADRPCVNNWSAVIEVSVQSLRSLLCDCPTVASQPKCVAGTAAALQRNLLFEDGSGNARHAGTCSAVLLRHQPERMRRHTRTARVW
jgi:hypothetical protein